MENLERGEERGEWIKGTEGKRDREEVEDKRNRKKIGKKRKGRKEKT